MKTLPILGILTLLLVGAASAVVIDGCYQTSSAGETIYLSNNFTIVAGNVSVTNCIDIIHANVRVDCLDRTITSYLVSGKSVIGSSGTNTTVQNCNIFNVNHTDPSLNGRGITIPNGYTNQNTVEGSSYGIRFENCDTSSPTSFCDSQYNTLNNNYIGLRMKAFGPAGLAGQMQHNTLFNNSIGIEADSAGENFTISDNILESNLVQLYLPGAAFIYNNLFNSSPNNFTGAGSNLWSKTFEPSSTNIIGQPGYGGNVYTNPSSTDYSDLCTDLQTPFGICDDPYQIATGRVDLYPIFLGNASSLAQNAYPGIVPRFLGTDEARENFVFSIGMNDEEGGNVYDALNLVFNGNNPNGTTIQNLYWDQTTLSRATPTVFSDCPTRTIAAGTSVPGGVIIYYGNVLHVNNTNGTYCTGGVEIALTALDFASGGTISIDNRFQFQQGATDTIGSYEFLDQNGDTLGNIIFYHNPFTDDTNITFADAENNETFINNATASDPITYRITSNLDFAARTQTYTVRANNIIIATINKSLPARADGFTANRFNSYMLDLEGVYIGPFIMNAVLTHGNNPYQFFATVQSGGFSIAKSQSLPIIGFGNYELRAYGTDDAHGTDDYTNYQTISFVYNNQTPALTTTQIQNLIDSRNSNYTQPGTEGGIVVSGDLATDILPRFWNAIGLKTAGSRIIAGFILLLIITVMFSAAGAIVVLFVDSITMVVFALPVVGLFPVWFIIIEIIIAAALIAIALRKAATGQ